MSLPPALRTAPECRRSNRGSPIDATVVMERPRIAPYVELMRQNIADALKISMQQISIKATTHEGLGFVGTEQGVAAHSVAMIIPG